MNEEKNSVAEIRLNSSLKREAACSLVNRSDALHKNGDFNLSYAERSYRMSLEKNCHKRNTCSPYDVETATNYDGHIDMQKLTKGKETGCNPFPILLKLSDVTYKVKLPRTMSIKRTCTGKQKYVWEKEILHGVNASVKPGDLVAVMGPSGCGKTTFLSLLAGRNRQQMTGEITYNGVTFDKTIKRRLAIVTQDDILHPHLTVRETLVYTAMLLLPRDLSTYEKILRTDQLIKDLKLDRCRDTRIGGPFLRGVSGGERKRVCIGQELLKDPSLLLLDEPTSGLDSVLASQIIEMFKDISLSGRTVITTIHQPSSKVFSTFNKLILISEGRIIYSGNASEAMTHFSSLGFNPQIPMNPADFLLRLSSGNAEHISLPTAFHACDVNEKGILKHIIHAYESMRHSPAEEAYPMYGLQPTIEPTNGEIDAHAASWWVQFSVLMSRSMKESIHECFSWRRLAPVVAVAVIAGLIWWQTDINSEQSLEDQVGIVIFMPLYWGFPTLYNTLLTFGSDKAILAKERLSDMYCLSAYFLARTLAIVALQLIPVAIFVAIVYLMSGLQLSIDAFFLTLVTVSLSAIISQGIGQAIAAAFMDLKVATSTAAVVSPLFLIASGYFVQFGQHTPRFIRWLKYSSYHYYAFRLLMKIQYGGRQLYDCTDHINGCKPLASSIAFHGINPGERRTEFWPLLMMAVGFRFLAYIGLRRMNLSV